MWVCVCVCLSEGLCLCDCLSVLFCLRFCVCFSVNISVCVYVGECLYEGLFIWTFFGEISRHRYISATRDSPFFFTIFKIHLHGGKIFQCRCRQRDISPTPCQYVSVRRDVLGRKSDINTFKGISRILVLIFGKSL